MKNILILILAIAFNCPLKAQSLLTKDHREVEQTVINIFDALSNRDSVMLKANCTDDILIFENGQVWNIDTMMKAIITLKKLDDYKRINKIEFMHTEIHNDVAWVTYRNQADITVNGKQRVVKWVETVILLNEKNKWKIKILHSTPDKVM
ncbi:MAG: nuclear transport factor 2 family protein [Chitinophagaceae bacterium]